MQDVEVSTYLPTYAIIWVLLVKHDSGPFFKQLLTQSLRLAAFVYRTCLTPESLQLERSCL